MSRWLQRQWAAYTFWHILLLPLSWLFFFLILVRKSLYKKSWLHSDRLAVPVVVVGNINVGGTGKTPVVIWLAEQLQLAGYRPGIISRGYGGSAQVPQAVWAGSNPQQVGDEPVLIAKRTACPVFVSADRVATGHALLKLHPECNVIISDDGLQHYRLQRDVEIIVIDSAKGFGNGALLPAGPLRESVSRLSTVDAVVSNGRVDGAQKFEQLRGVAPIEMQLLPADFVNLSDHHIRCSAAAFANQPLLAIAGIGNPERFFQQLRQMGLSFRSQAYPDHYAFSSQDFENAKNEVVLMTEKDAVKCQAFAQPNFWALPVRAVINDDLITIILNKLRVKR
jgi:tetraacyldisaccharide 4'-kinase